MSLPQDLTVGQTARETVAAGKWLCRFLSYLMPGWGSPAWDASLSSRKGSVTIPFQLFAA